MKLHLFKKLVTASLLLCWIAGCSIDDKINVSNIKQGDILEFYDTPMLKECTEPDIIKVSILGQDKAKVYVKHVGCPNGRVTEEEGEFDYRLDDAKNWRHEYNWLKTDPKVLILENPKAGYSNGYMELAKRYLISNAYNEKEFIEFRIFEQLDPEQYRARNGVFTSAGGLKK